MKYFKLCINQAIDIACYVVFEIAMCTLLAIVISIYVFSMPLTWLGRENLI